MARLRKLHLCGLRNWPDSKPAQCVLSKIVRRTDAEHPVCIRNVEFRGQETPTMQAENSDAGGGKRVAATARSIAVVDAGSVQALAPNVKASRIDGKLPEDADTVSTLKWPKTINEIK